MAEARKQRGIRTSCWPVLRLHRRWSSSIHRGESATRFMPHASVPPLSHGLGNPFLTASFVAAPALRFFFMRFLPRRTWVGRPPNVPMPMQEDQAGGTALKERDYPHIPLLLARGPRQGDTGAHWSPAERSIRLRAWARVSIALPWAAPSENKAIRPSDSASRALARSASSKRIARRMIAQASSTGGR